MWQYTFVRGTPQAGFERMSSQYQAGALTTAPYHLVKISNHVLNKMHCKIIYMIYISNIYKLVRAISEQRN